MKESVVHSEAEVPTCDAGLFYKTLLESSTAGICILDVQGRVKYCMLSVKRMFGFTPEEITGSSFFKLMHPDDAEKSAACLAAVTGEPGKTLQFNARFRHRDGHWRTLEIRAVNMLDNPVVNGISINYRDITDGEKLEMALKESEERYRNLVENTQETIFIIDAEHDKILDFNENALKLFGYTRPQLLQLSVSQLLPPCEKSLELSREKVKEAFRNGKSSYEVSLMKAGGDFFPVQIHLTHFPPLDRKLLRGTVIDITEKIEFEKKMRQQETEYRHLATVSPVGIFRTDRNGKTIYVNEKWCAIAGITAEEATGTGWTNSIHPEDRGWALKEWKKNLKQRSPSRAEFRFLSPGGKTTWVLGEAVPYFDNHGNFLGYAGSITDITERVLAGQALARSEQRNSVLLHAIPDMIFRISKNGTFLDSKVAANFKPLVPPELFMGKKISEVLPPDVSSLCMKNLRKAIKTNEIQTYHYSLPSPDEPSRLNYFEARIVAYDSHEALALIRDITPQKKAELSLKASEERWKSLVKSAPQYILTIDNHDRITYINYLKELKPDQIIGKTIHEIFRDSHISKKRMIKMLKAARAGNQNSVEIPLKIKNKVIWLNVKAAPVISGEGVPELIVMALDITERKKAEDELKQSNEKLKALYQRLESIREEEKKNIALEIHDELGQELTAIKLGIFWLQQYFEKEIKKPDLGQVQRKVNSLIELITQTITSARRLAHQLRPIVLDNLGLIPAIEWQIEKLNEGGSVRFFFNTNVTGEQFNQEFSIALFRIIQESLTNILRHSRAKRAYVDLHIQHHQLVLAVEDNGVGILPSDLKKPDKIGIFGMRERIKAWSGEFEIAGKPGKGTGLKIVFPLKAISI